MFPVITVIEIPKLNSTVCTHCSTISRIVAMLLLRDALIEVRWHQSRTSVEICQCLFKESNVGEGWQGSSTYLFSFENISEGNRDRSSCDVIVNGIRVAAVIEQGQG